MELGTPSGNCAICSQIPRELSAHTSNDEYLPATTDALKHHKAKYDSLGVDHDLWECPECGRFYMYTTESSFTGSLNNDYDSLQRLSRPQSAVVRAMLEARGEPAELEEALFALPTLAFELTLPAACAKSPAFVAKFLLRIVREYARLGPSTYGAHPTRDVLHALIAHQPSYAQRIRDCTEALSPEERARLGDLEHRVSVELGRQALGDEKELPY